MLKVVICCQSSLTTNIMVAKVKEAIKNSGIDAEITALAETAITKDIDADVILLAPQIRYTQADVEKIVENRIPVAVIDNIDFATGDGAAVVELIKRVTK